MHIAPEAFFLSAAGGARGQRLCLHHRPHGPRTHGAIVYAHPFAEEMNKSRRMAALQARAFAQAGYAVLQIDLLGCGDSSGDFGDASWVDWIDDVAEAARWMQQRYAAPLWLWGLRAGCLLAAEASRRLDSTCDFMFWQPSTAGKTLLQQFLRLKVAGDMLDGKAKGVMQGLRQQLAGGAAAEVAGYSLSPNLASGLEQAQLTPPKWPARLEWLEVSSRPDASLSPASAQAIERWQQAGCSVRSQRIDGPAFWQTTEIEEAPALIVATLAALAKSDALAA